MYALSMARKCSYIHCNRFSNTVYSSLTSIYCTHTHISINFSPAWITLFPSWRLMWPPSSPALLTLDQPLCTLHVPEHFFLSVCLSDELSGLIHLPDFLCLILLFDVTTMGLFLCLLYRRSLRRKSYFAEPLMNFSSLPGRKCLKIYILCFALAAVFSVV